MAKIIMLQGTSSGVGKSTVTTALCRIFKQDGYKVAPFKAQNMSSNAHLLPNGDKMARSQAIAAYACELNPDYKMNPILLIPKNNETEVYLNGKFKGTMNSYQYKDIKTTLLNEVLDSFNQLCKENDIVVIEGAGSPVELNLIQSDIVNMGFAKIVNTPVLLISDILRGGIFASLYGTLNLMPKQEQNLIKGLIVNKFKGKTEYFEDGKKILENICKKDVLGVLPYFNINIEDEDCLTDGIEMKTKENIMKNSDTSSENEYMNFLQNQFDLLANNFRQNLNMEKIYNILNGGV